MAHRDGQAKPVHRLLGEDGGLVPQACGDSAGGVSASSSRSLTSSHTTSDLFQTRKFLFRQPECLFLRMNNSPGLRFSNMFEKKTNFRAWLQLEAAHKLLRANQSRRKNTLTVTNVPGQQQADSSNMALPSTHSRYPLSFVPF